MSCSDRLLDEVRDMQAALLRVLESRLEPLDKAEAARRLLARARAHELAEITVTALQWVLNRDLDELTEDPAEYGAPAERRVLELLRDGEDTCQRCLLPLPAASTIRHWQRERALSALWRDWLRARSDRGAA